MRARRTAYLGHSAGLDFETKLYAKVNAAELLERELASRRYVPKVIALGAVTDPYQPIEREHRITRAVLEVLDRASHPVGIVTKSALVVRDVDILSRMASRGLAKVAISVTTLDRRSRARWSRARPRRRAGSKPSRRLSDAGVPVAVMVAPIVPAINDSEIESILAAARQAGATEAGYVLLRLPLELKELFREWLADRVSRSRRARDQHSALDARRQGLRRRSSGCGSAATAPMPSRSARASGLAAKRLGLNERNLQLRTDLFQRPVAAGGQLPLL